MLQLGLLLLVAAYLVHRWVVLHKRIRESWPAIVERLQPGLSTRGTSANMAAELDSRFTNEAIEERVATPEGRRRMFRDASVMLEMADYAEQNGGAETAPVVARLRDHAMTIRIGVVKRLLRRG